MAARLLVIGECGARHRHKNRLATPPRRPGARRAGRPRLLADQANQGHPGGQGERRERHVWRRRRAQFVAFDLDTAPALPEKMVKSALPERFQPSRRRRRDGGGGKNRAVFSMGAELVGQQGG